MLDKIRSELEDILIKIVINNKERSLIIRSIIVDRYEIFYEYTTIDREKEKNIIDEINNSESKNEDFIKIKNLSYLLDKYIKNAKNLFENFLLNYDDIIFSDYKLRSYAIKNYAIIIIKYNLIPENLLHLLRNKNQYLINKLLEYAIDDQFIKYFIISGKTNIRFYFKFKLSMNRNKLLNYCLEQPFEKLYDKNDYEYEKLEDVKKEYFSYLLKNDIEKILDLDNKLIPLSNISNIISEHKYQNEYQNEYQNDNSFSMSYNLLLFIILHILPNYDKKIYFEILNIINPFLENLFNFIKSKNNNCISFLKENNICFITIISKFFINYHFITNYQNIFAAHFQKNSFLFDQFSENLLYDARIWKIVDKFLLSK